MDPAAPAIPLSSNMLIAAAIAQVVTFLGVIVGLLFTFLRDGRTRQWLKEDREYAAKEIAATAAESRDAAANTATKLAAHTADIAAKLQQDRADLAAQAVETARVLAEHTTEVGTDLKVMALTKANDVQTSITHLAADVAATKEAAGAAYKEANHVNLKLAALGIERQRNEAELSDAIVRAVRAEFAKRDDAPTK